MELGRFSCDLGEQLTTPTRVSGSCQTVHADMATSGVY